MPADPPAPSDLERLFDLLEPLLAAETVDSLLERATRLAASLTQAYATAIFVTDGGSVVHEAWEPEDEGRSSRLRPHFLGLTLQSVQAGEPTILPFPSGAATGLEPHLFLLQARGRALGTLCCARLPGERRDRDRAVALMGHVARVLAQRIAALQELSSWRVTRAQYERWFRQLDNHIRTLDRERQKFAALVNQNDVYVFVADAARTIRWANRALGTRFPVESGAPTWIGRCCGDLCRLFGDGNGDGGCAVSRALERNQVVHEEFRQPSPDGDRNLYVTALPIKGPDGRPHEVLVMLQDLSGLETLRKSEARYRALFEERQKAEEALNRLETRLRTVVAASPIVLFSVDRNGVFTLSEGRGLEAQGLAPGERVGQSIYELYRDVPAVGENIRRALRGEEFSSVIEVRGRTYDTHYAPLRDARGEITGVLGVATDITGAGRANREAA